MKVKPQFNKIVEIDGTEVTLIPVVSTYDKGLKLQTSTKEECVGYLLTLPESAEADE